MCAKAAASPRRTGVALLVLIGVVQVGLVAFGGVGAAVATHASSAGELGTTEGWLDGRTVTFFYPKSFSCTEPPESGAGSHCEVGEEAQTPPRPGEGISTLHVVTPLGFRPDESTLHCPETGSCINHPSTLDVSRIFGPGFESIPLPPHSHIVDVAQGGWWEIEAIGVTDPAVWDEIATAKDLATVRALQAEGVGITPDIPSNLFLFFNVLEESER